MKLMVGEEVRDIEGTPAQIIAATNPSGEQGEALPVRGGWGASKAEAVELHAEDLRRAGISPARFHRLEYEFVAGYFRVDAAKRLAAGDPLIGIHHKVESQRLEEHGGRIFDVLLVRARYEFRELPTHEDERTFNFDITDVYGEPEATPTPPSPAVPAHSKGPEGAPVPIGWKVAGILGPILALLAWPTALYFASSDERVPEQPLASEPEALEEAAPAPPRLFWIEPEEATFLHWDQPVALTDTGRCTGAFFVDRDAEFGPVYVEFEFEIRPAGSTGTLVRRTGGRPSLDGSGYGTVNKFLYPDAATRGPIRTSADLQEVRSRAGFEVTSCRVAKLRVARRG